MYIGTKLCQKNTTSITRGKKKITKIQIKRQMFLELLPEVLK